LPDEPLVVANILVAAIERLDDQLHRSLVRELAEFGGDYARYVTPPVHEAVKKRYPADPS